MAAAPYTIPAESPLPTESEERCEALQALSQNGRNVRVRAGQPEETWRSEGSEGLRAPGTRRV